MALYKNIVHWDYNLIFGDFVSWIRYPFMDYKHNPIFRVLEVNNDYTVNLLVVRSDYIPTGTIFYNQQREGLRRVKLFTLGSDFQYKKGV